MACPPAPRSQSRKNAPAPVTRPPKTTHASAPNCMPSGPLPSIAKVRPHQLPEQPPNSTPRAPRLSIFTKQCARTITSSSNSSQTACPSTLIFKKQCACTITPQTASQITFPSFLEVGTISGGNTHTFVGRRSCFWAVLRRQGWGTAKSWCLRFPHDNANREKRRARPGLAGHGRGVRTGTDLRAL